MTSLHRDRVTTLAQPAMARHNRTSTGALSLLRRKRGNCCLLPVIAGAQTRRCPAQLMTTEDVLNTERMSNAMISYLKYYTHWL